MVSDGLSADRLLKEARYAASFVRDLLREPTDQLSASRFTSNSIATAAVVTTKKVRPF